MTSQKKLSGRRWQKILVMNRDVFAVVAPPPWQPFGTYREVFVKTTPQFPTSF